MENPEINKAVTQLGESAFSEAQLLGYDRFWDMVSTAKMQISSSRREAREKGLAEGRAEGEKKKAVEVAQRMKQKGYPVSEIAECSGLSEEEIGRL